MNIDNTFRDRVKRYVEESKESEKAVHLNRVVTTAIEGFRGRARAVAKAGEIDLKQIIVQALSMGD